MTAMGLGLGLDLVRARDTATPDLEVTRVTAVPPRWAGPAMGLLPADQDTAPLRSADRLQVPAMAPHSQAVRAAYPRRGSPPPRPEGRVMVGFLR